MLLPTTLIQSLQGVAGFNEETFLQVHASGEQVTSVRFNPAKCERQSIAEGYAQVPWTSYGFYLAQRPVFTLDPLLHAGVYYVQEASSMFVEQALKQNVDTSKPLKVLDLCAAPGGKSTLLQSIISKQSLLVSNEVIKARVNILEENITKWGAANVVVTNNDPKDFARLENYFDVIVIDAPCSGSGLFRRDAEAIKEWSENNVQLCSQRQQRILADVWPALKQDGILVYSTCSYSVEEDEGILDWISEAFDVSSLSLQLDEAWNIVKTISKKSKSYGYRFYPDKVKGEGFFIAAFKKNDGAEFDYPKPKKLVATNAVSKMETEQLTTYLTNEPFYFFKQNNIVHALPTVLEKELQVLQSALYIKKAGVAIGELTRKELIPEHALAVSDIINPQLPAFAVTLEEALQYLRKQDMQLHDAPKGWCLLQYEGHNLGWAKVLPNRLNNYYPKEWRVRMGG